MAISFFLSMGPLLVGSTGHSLSGSCLGLLSHSYGTDRFQLTVKLDILLFK